jgi:hypothetical protein
MQGSAQRYFVIEIKKLFSYTSQIQMGARSSVNLLDPASSKYIVKYRLFSSSERVLRS